MLCIAGKLYADDVMLAVFCGKFYGLRRKMQNTADVLYPNIGKNHKNNLPSDSL
jgi:hypothetical protein